uniref:L-gulonate 3-dehydrogenase n=1 Tax=Hucho hucho TaxID=62062 RepID=A0A4W5MYN1_9TELE
ISSSEAKTITVIGSGLIGCSWAMVFMSGGYRVKIYDNQPGQAARAFQEVRKQLEELQEPHMLRGQLSASEHLALLSSHGDLPQALAGAFFIQESVFEEIEDKQSVFQVVESHVGEGVILSSSTSCLLPSNVFSRLQNRKRCIISHPVSTALPQTPRLCPICHPNPIPFGQSLAHGYSLNRVQYAIIAESWRLVKDGVISVKDIDLVMSEGLGMRYTFIGPMETMHLNAPEGLEDYLQRYREGMRSVLTAFGPVPEFSGEAAEGINKEMCELIPADPQHLSARRERRDQLLMGLAKLKK